MTGARVDALPASHERWDTDLRHYRHRDGTPIELFAHLAEHPRALDDLRSATSAALTADLPVRFRELLILRVCARTGCWSEWDAHVALFADAAGLGEDDLGRLASTGPVDEFSFDDRLPVAVADELVTTTTLTTSTWNALRAAMTQSQALDCLMVAGQYLKVCWLANALGLNGQDSQVRRSM